MDNVHGARAVRHAAISLGGLVGGTLVLFFFTPMLLRGLGSEGYGLFTLALSVSGILGLLDLGIGPAVTRELAQHAGREGPDLAAFTRSAVAIALGFGAFGILVCWFVAPTIVGWLQVPESSRAIAIAAIHIAGFILATRLLSSVFNAVLTGYQRFDLLAVFAVGLPMASTLGALVLVWRGGDAVAATRGAFLGSAAMLVAHAVTTRLTVPHVRLTPALSSPALRRLSRFGGVIFLTQLCGVLLLQVDKFIIGRLVGVEALGDYSVIFGVAFRIQMVLAAAAGVVFPMTAAFAGRADQERVVQLYAEALRLAAVAGLLLLIPLVALARLFLTLWISPDFAVRLEPVFVLVACSSFVLGAVIVPHHVLNGLGLPHWNFLVALAVLTLSIAGHAMLAARFGLLGAGLASLLATTPALLLLPLAERALGARALGRGVCMRVLAAAVPSLLLGRALAAAADPTWAYLVVAGALTAAGMLACAWAVGLVGRRDADVIRRALSAAPRVTA